jgi:hypothetical protein
MRGTKKTKLPEDSASRSDESAARVLNLGVTAARAKGSNATNTKAKILEFIETWFAIKLYRRGEQGPKEFFHPSTNPSYFFFNSAFLFFLFFPPSHRVID